jgi:hypothetical protein
MECVFYYRLAFGGGALHLERKDGILLREQ